MNWCNSTQHQFELSYKATPADFIVTELPHPALTITVPGKSSAPVHWYGFVQKQNRNTASVAKQLAASLGQAESSVGYAGLKDKAAITRQWFSLPIAALAGSGKSQLLAAIDEDPSLALLQQSSGAKKLRRGQLAGNHFSIVLSLNAQHRDQLETALVRVQQQGFPNYFGPQRFGNNGSNLATAMRWLESRQSAAGRGRSIKPFTKALHLSVLRSYLFNEVLARRVSLNNWTQVIDGDLCLGAVPTAPLWGRGRSQTQRRAAIIEAQALTAHADIQQGLEFAGVVQQRRALYTRPKNLRWHWGKFSKDQVSIRVRLEFALPAGCYATSLLAELGTIKSVGTQG